MLNIAHRKKGQILVILKNQKLSHTLKSQYQINNFGGNEKRSILFLNEDVIRKNIGNIKIEAIENAKIFLIKLPYCFTEPKVNPLTKCL